MIVGLPYTKGESGSDVSVKQLAKADVLVDRSKQSKDGWIKAQGLTFVETMLAGCSDIGSRSGGILDTVIPSATAWLTEPNEAKALSIQLKCFFNSAHVKGVTRYARKFSERNYLLKSTASIGRENITISPLGCK